MTKSQPAGRLSRLGTSPLIATWVRRRSGSGSAHMFDGGVTRTRGRHGVLVYVSALERRVRVVFDDGLVAARTDPAVLAIVRDLEHATARFDREAFVAALRALPATLKRICGKCCASSSVISGRLRLSMRPIYKTTG